MRRILFIGIILLLSLNMVAGTTITYAAKPQVQCISHSEVKFENEFRRLWVDHVLWTSNYITSATTAGAEDQKQVLNRLLKNQEDIGNAIKPIYGEKAGKKNLQICSRNILLLLVKL